MWLTKLFKREPVHSEIGEKLFKLLNDQDGWREGEEEDIVHTCGIGLKYVLNPFSDTGPSVVVFAKGAEGYCGLNRDDHKRLTPLVKAMRDRFVELRWTQRARQHEQTVRDLL